MCSRFLCCVVLCLLGADSVHPGVTQVPKYLVKAINKKSVTLECFYESGHLYVYWYQQIQGKGPEFMTQWFDGKEAEKGKVSTQFTVQQFKNDYRSKLNVTSLELTDSALYLCASSKAQTYISNALEHKNLFAQLRK